MKVRVCYTVDVTDDYRRAINMYYGESGLADRREVKEWCRSYGDSMDADLMQSLQLQSQESESEEED